MDALKKQLDEMKETFTYRMKDFQKDLQKGNSDTASPSSRLASDFAVFRTFVMTSLECLQSQMELMSRLADQMESRSRRKILLIHGVPETKNENTASLVAETLAKHLTVPALTPDSFSKCHRMGQAKSDKPRVILIKCRDHLIKSKMWHDKKGLKNTGLTLSEFLTKPRHDAFMAARKKFGIKQCWTRDGCVYVMDSTGNRHKVFTVGELDAIPGEGSPVSTPNDVIRQDVTPTVPRSRPKRNLRNK
ncbi:unnamed protein product [Leptosia nina]|uniref:Uncharacterized protein n=1 Tax=Leptosia nina TaxID=320188 RepID=A0AAV1JWE5_9NEOP